MASTSKIFIHIIFSNWIGVNTRPILKCVTLVEELHAVQRRQRGEQAGVEPHCQEIPEPTLIQSLGTFRHTTERVCVENGRTVGPNGSQCHARVSLEFIILIILESSWCLFNSGTTCEHLLLKKTK